MHDERALPLASIPCLISKYSRMDEYIARAKRQKNTPFCILHKHLVHFQHQCYKGQRTTIGNGPNACVSSCLD
jgi:hypothetical protein